MARGSPPWPQGSGTWPMSIEWVAGTGVFGLLAIAFIYTLRRTKDADERRDEGADMVAAGLEAELARANKRADGLVSHYERLLREKDEAHDRQLERERAQFEMDRSWMQEQIEKATKTIETLRALVAELRNR